MLVLAVETATDLSGCALADETGVLAEVRLLPGRRHAEALAPQMRFVCQQADVPLSAIDAVAVDVGPGLYTGLRAGLAAAQALAFALNVGVAQVFSLEVLASGAGRSWSSGVLPRRVLSVLDARRGEVYWAWSSVTANGEVAELSRPCVGKPETLAAQIAAASIPRGKAPSEGCEPILLVGEGALLHADLLTLPAHTELAAAELGLPSPAAAALLGRARAFAGDVVSSEAVEPVYLRSPDAVAPAAGSVNP